MVFIVPRDEEQPREDSAAALRAIAERVVDDERARGLNLTTKSSTLAGFSGTILAIVTVLGRELFRLDLGNVGDPLVRLLLIVSVLALAAAATFAIGGVLRTQPRLLLDADQIVEFAGPRWLAAAPREINGNMLVSLGRGLKEERRLNDRKARRADHAARALLVGLFAVAAQAVVLAVDELVY